ncbi:hypothetical protein LCGC14_1084940 [marine sediment metagenome]|uniref:Uncharacterized protein n=1 Tax=marine sediment metagenome TaxID=412755 RepID=A0A0F9PX76_9ZZZZ
MNTPVCCKSYYEALMTQIIRKLERKLQCNCDLDKWEPHPVTGHTLGCCIHDAAAEHLQAGMMP